MKKYFELVEPQAAPHKFFINVVHENVDKFFKPPFTSSFGILPARLLDLSWANYLRFCRDVLGASLSGKNTLYIVPYFQKTQEVQVFVRLLNKRMEYLEYEYNNPIDESQLTPGLALKRWGMIYKETMKIRERLKLDLEDV